MWMSINFEACLQALAEWPRRSHALLQVFNTFWRTRS